jgi:hypothetical protein
MRETEKQIKIEAHRKYFMAGMLTADELAEAVDAIVNDRPAVWVLIPTGSTLQEALNA